MTRSPSATTSSLSNIFLVLTLVGMWITFAPTKIGGSASYVIVDGKSMEPNFHLGDLVIVRSATSYNIGDIVTYWDEALSAYIIHRVVDVEQGLFVLQGDNNGWIDEARPSTKEIIGKLWLHIPRMGKIMAWVRAPLHFALITALFGGILMTSFISKPGKAQAKTTNPNYLEVGVYIALAIFLTFLSLFIYAFSRKAEIPANATLYQQEGRFSYTAESIPGIYDAATITSGEPIFPSQTCMMNVDFSYYISNSQLQSVTGNHQLYARVLHEQSGWRRTIPISEESFFSGNTFVSTGTLDLCQVEQLIESLENETGLNSSNYKLQIIAPVLISASIAEKNIKDSFFPTLTFKFDEIHFYLESSDRSDAAFTFTKAGTNNGIITEQPNYANLLGLKFNVQSLRILSVTGLLFSIGVFAIISLYIYLIAQEDPQFLVHLKYSNLLVDVQGATFEPASPVLDVDSMQTLAKLAERHNTMILHITHPMLHDYLVQTTQSTYRYSLHRNKLSSIPVPIYQEEILESYPVSYKTTPPQSIISPQNQQQSDAHKTGYW